MRKQYELALKALPPDLANIIGMRDEADQFKVSWVPYRHTHAAVSLNNVNLQFRFQMIKSYEVIVALIDHDTKIIWEPEHFSRTTTSQITKIHREFFPTYTRIKLY